MFGQLYSVQKSRWQVIFLALSIESKNQGNFKLLFVQISLAISEDIEDKQTNINMI